MSRDDQWNATIDSNIIINESECILPCSYICETSLNEFELPRDFDTNFCNSFCKMEDIDKLDINVLLEDNVTQEIYNYGMNGDSKMYHINELKFKETSGVCAVNNDNIRKHIMVNIMNKLKKKRNNSQLKSKNHFRVQSFESNNTSKPSINVPNNMLKQQFSIFDDIETLPYLPLPAMQLMINIELSNTKYNSCKDYNKRRKKSISSTDNINKKCENPFKPCKNYRPSTSNIVKTKRRKVCKKDTHKIERVNAENVKLSSKLTSIIPLPVLHYMNILESVKTTQNVPNTKLINELLNNW